MGLLPTDFLGSGIVARFPRFAADTTQVIVGPYDYARSGVTANFGVGAGESVFECITIGHKYRVRQNGTVSRVRLYTVSTTNLTGAWVRVWRLVGTTYDLVGTSNNIIGSLTDGAFASIDLTAQIESVREGDFIGLRLESSGGGKTFVGYSPSGASTRYITTGSALTTGMDWAAQNSTATVMPIELYMQAPQAVLIGDSIASGYPAHYSFLHTNDVTDVGSTITHWLSTIAGYTIQNMGVSGNTSTQIAARFVADLVNLRPRLAIIEGGINDMGSYVPVTSKATYLANWTAMLAAAQASTSVERIVAMAILPWTNGSAAQHRIVDDWTASLAELVAGYSKAVLVDASDCVGQNRPSGDAGNLWDIKDGCSYDGVHFTAAGHAQIARAIAIALAEPSPSGAVGRGVNVIHLPYGGSKTLRLEYPGEWDAESITGVTIEINSVSGTQLLALDNAEPWASDPVTLDGEHAEFADQLTLTAGAGSVGSLAPGDRLLIGASDAGPDEVVEVRSYDSVGKVATLTADLRHSHSDGATVTGLWATYDLDLSDTDVWTLGVESIIVWTPNSNDFPARARAVVSAVSLVVVDLERRFQALHPREYDALLSPIDRFAMFREEAISRLGLELAARGLDIQRVQDQPALVPVVIEQIRWLSLLNGDDQDIEERRVCREELTRQIELLCKHPLWVDGNQDGVEVSQETQAHPVWFERGM